MACERYEALNRFHDGDLPPAEAGEFRKHLQTCLECKAELHHLEQTESQVRDVVCRALPSGTLSEKVVRRIQQENIKISKADPSGIGNTSPFSWHSLVKMLVPALAAVLLVVAFRARTIPTGTGNQLRSPIISAQALSDHEMIGEERFAANTVRQIPPDATLKVQEKIAVSWFEGRQNVEITGFAQIRLNQQRLTWDSGDAEIRFTLVEPFMVNVGTSELTITGTRLHLRGVGTDSVVITLMEGHVRYHTQQGDGEFIPGTPLVFSKNGCHPELSDPRPAQNGMSSAPSLQPMIGSTDPLSKPFVATGPDHVSPFEGNPVNVPNEKK